MVLVLLFTASVNACFGAPQPTKYKGIGVFAQEKGLEANVIVENGLVRVWYTHLNYINSNYAIGGSLYGTRTIPFLNSDHSVYYMECPTASFESAVLSGGAIPWQNEGLCISYHGESCVRKGPDGKYHCVTPYFAPDGQTRRDQADYYISNTGNPGTWTLVQNNVVTLPNGWGPYLGNVSFLWDTDGLIKLVQEFYAGGTNWDCGIFQGSSLTALSYVTGSAHSGISAGDLQKINGIYVMWAHKSVPAGNPLTDLILVTTSDFTSNWSFISWLYGNASVSSNTNQFFQNNQSWPYNTDSQLADPALFEINGRTYVMYEDEWQEMYEVPSLAVAYWNDTLVNVATAYGAAGLISSAPAQISSKATMKASSR
jgi:hypothetical protein